MVCVCVGPPWLKVIMMIIAYRSYCKGFEIEHYELNCIGNNQKNHDNNNNRKRMTTVMIVIKKNKHNHNVNNYNNTTDDNNKNDPQSYNNNNNKTHSPFSQRQSRHYERAHFRRKTFSSFDKTRYCGNSERNGIKSFFFFLPQERKKNGWETFLTLARPDENVSKHFAENRSHFNSTLILLLFFLFFIFFIFLI